MVADKISLVRGGKVKPIEIGLIGYGSIGKVHSIGYNNLDTIFSDNDINYKMKYLLRRKSSPVTKNDWKERISKLKKLQEVDLVDICSPNFLHYPQVKKILKYDLNIYCEKPLGINYKESEELANKVENKDLINQVALVYRFLPAIAKTKAIIEEGFLGQIINFDAQLLHSSYLNPERPINWRLEKEKSGGGALLDLGIHMVDTIRFILGEIKSLQAVTKTIFKERYENEDKNKKSKVNVDDWGKISVELENDIYGTIESSKVSFNPKKDFVLVIYGTKGMIRITNDSEILPEYFGKEINKTNIKNVNNKYSKFVRRMYPSNKISLGLLVNLHLASQLNMLLNIKNKEKRFAETPDFREAARSQKVIDKSYESAKNGGEKIKL